MQVEITPQHIENRLAGKGFKTNAVSVKWYRTLQMYLIEVWFDVRDNGYCAITENGTIDAPLELHFSLSLNCLADSPLSNEIIDTLLNKKKRNIVEVMTIVPKQGGTDFSKLGDGRLLPRDYARENLQELISFDPHMANLLALDSSFRQEDWFPE